MSENVEFYPERESLEVNPLEGSEVLQYVLKGAGKKLKREELQLRFAFPAKLELETAELKESVKKILIEILNVANFGIEDRGDHQIVTVPINALQDAAVLPQKGTLNVPVLIKLVKLASGKEPESTYRCRQEILLMTDVATQQEAPADEEDEETEQEVDQNEEDHAEEEPAPPPAASKKQPAPAKQPEKQPASRPNPPAKKQAEAPKAKKEEEEGQEGEESQEPEEVDENALKPSDYYSGLVAVDYGTSNSSVSVRDPRFASEEVRGQLGSEQWQSFCEWMNLWLSEHLAPVEPSHLDQFVHSLTAVVPNANIPECGSPSSEITQAINRLDDKIRLQVLSELICRLSNYQSKGSDANTMKKLALETIQGLEAVIDSKNLESQRYFVLELDKNVGPGPISSVLQVLHIPATDDPDVLTQETQVDMGARVGLLLHSASLGEIDIRQFVISSKRYFGRNEVISVVPNDGSEVFQFPADILAKLTYKELFNRTVADIHRRAEQGQFQDAKWLRTVVSTFPTSYPAALRRSIRELLGGLEIHEVDTRFDEATAAAVYYIWREIGADPVCGMHGLMARSRKDKFNRAYQNMLLYDLGGGTTDIALIQLLYEEVHVFEEGEDRGKGGCYFRITPRLLGTTGHRHLGGDLITLWLFRYIKAKLADLLLTNITTKNLEPPIDSPIQQMLNDIPEQLLEESGQEESLPKYRPESLLEWALHPSQMLNEYKKLNEKVIDLLIPTRFVNDQSKAPSFFTLWEICDELKKALGTPIIEHFGTCLGMGLAEKWPNEVELDSGQLYNFIQMIHPWLTEGGHIQQDDLHIVITQEEMNNVIRDTVSQSISLASSLAEARLVTHDRRDRVDRLIFAGLSCNMKVIQDVAQEVFREGGGDIFDYDPANVRFDRDSAKTSVAMGACIGRYMESVRVDPNNEKTRQLLRDGYDQIELVIENLFSYLPCRLAYDSLVAMVPIFDQGQELNVKSYWTNQAVARTSLKSLRPVQEKFWIYRIDFVGAEPQYLGLINAEALARENGFEDFRKFREEYVVGFEADAELLVRGFFLPKGQNEIVVKEGEHCDATEGGFIENAIITSEQRSLDVQAAKKKKAQEKLEAEDAEDAEDQNAEDQNAEDQNAEDQDVEGQDAEEEEEAPKANSGRPNVPRPSPAAAYVMNKTIAVREILEDIPVIAKGEPLRYTVTYPDGTSKACCISEAIHIRKNLNFTLQDPDEEKQNLSREEDIIARFEIDEDEAKEITLVCDEDGKLTILTSFLFQIDIWAEIQYEAQKVDINLDPFGGHH